MKTCPFCAEEIQDKAVKCKHCGEWLSDSDSSEYPQDIPDFKTQRVLCIDGNCIGVINKDGICFECKRSINEIRAGIKSKNQHNDIFIPLTKAGKQQIVKPKTVKAEKWLSCPKCGGKAFGGRGCWIIGLMVLFFPIGLLLLLLKPTYNCSNCGYRFQS